MNRLLFAFTGVFLLAVAGVQFSPGTGLFAPTSAAEKAGGRILKAALELLGSLNGAQDAKAVIDFASAERFNWHFIPRDRQGLPLKEMEEAQRAKTLALLRASLSEEGARRAEAVMSLEDVLREIEGAARQFPRDPQLYYVTFFGRPSATGKWGWRLEGHHLTLNFTLEGERLVSATPAVLGANPAIVREGPRKGLRILAALEDLARELVGSLDDAGLKACTGEAGGKVPDEVPGPGSQRYDFALPAGLPADKLAEEQKGRLRKLIREYTANLPAEAEADMLTEDLKGVYLAWRGSLKPYEPHSYLIHGPGFVINYTNIQNGAAHVHSCLRTRRGEFGLAAAAK